MQEQKRAADQGAKPEDLPEAQHDKVPEWAEDMEHTLRRLVKAREQERAKRPGLYL